MAQYFFYAAKNRKSQKSLESSSFRRRIPKRSRDIICNGSVMIFFLQGAAQVSCSAFH